MFGKEMANLLYVSGKTKKMSLFYQTYTMVNVENRRGVSKMKPNIIKDYNAGMSGIDRADQMMSYNSRDKQDGGIKKSDFI